MKLPVLAVALFLSAAFAGPPPDRGEGASHVLRVRIFSDPQYFDWHLYRSHLDGWILSNLMEGLVQISPSGQALPALATRWKSSADQRTWTFYLRKGVKWSDGVPLKAHDFIASWERLLAPASYTNGAAYLLDVVNAEEFHKGRIADFKQVGIKALDDATLEVKLTSPMADWFWYASVPSLYPIREDLIRQDPMGWTRPGKLVTLGPFTLQHFEPGRQVTLVRNSNYYGKHGNLVQIEYGIVPDDELAVRLFERGQFDFVPKLARATAEKSKGRPEFISWPDWRLHYLLLNPKVEPTSDPRVRRAIAMSLDRARLAQFVGGECDSATSIVPKGLEGSGGDAGLRTDPAAAQEALKSSRFASLKSLKLLAQASAEGTALSHFVEEELKKNLGINVATDLKEPKDFYSVVTNHSAYALDLGLWTCDFPDPDDYFMIFLSSGNWIHGTWMNEEYDRLVVAARSYPTSEGRALAYKRAQKILLEDDAVAVPLCHGRISGLVSPRVKGFKPGPMTWWNYRDLSVR